MSTEAEQAHLKQQALEWQVILWSGEVTLSEQAGFDAWLAGGQGQQQAWAELQAMQQILQGIPGQASGWLKDKHKSKSEKRRQLLQLLGLVSVVGGTLPLVRRSDTWQALAADQQTHTGEQRQLTLPDGSQLTLNTASRVDIDFNAEARRLILHSGEIYLASTPDPARPLQVQTVHGLTQTQETQFIVRLKTEETRVSVLQGTALLSPHTGQSYMLQIGLQAGLTSTGVQTALPNGNEAAWLEGKLIAERTRLGDFLDELSRYRPGVIRYSEAVGQMVLSGVYPLADTDHILTSLLQALPLRISYFSRYWVSVSGR